MSKFIGDFMMGDNLLKPGSKCNYCFCALVNQKRRVLITQTAIHHLPSTIRACRIGDHAKCKSGCLSYLFCYLTTALEHDPAE